MLRQLPNGSVISDVPPEAWVDTCVMLEVDSAGDLMRAKREQTPVDVEKRRIRMRSTLWMAMVMSLRNVVTISYSHEFIYRMQQFFQDPEQRKWSFVLHNLFHEGGVLAGWNRHTTSAADVDERGKRLSKNQRDSFMREQCRKLKMVYITHDEPSITRAKAIPISVYRPHEYASQYMTLDAAREEFMSRLCVAMDWFVAATPVEYRQQRRRDMRGVQAVYEFVWNA